jgi:hypothetical protein
MEYDNFDAMLKAQKISLENIIDPNFFDIEDKEIIFFNLEATLLKVIDSQLKFFMKLYLTENENIYNLQKIEYAKKTGAKFDSIKKMENKRMLELLHKEISYLYYEITYKINKHSRITNLINLEKPTTIELQIKELENNFLTPLPNNNNFLKDKVYIEFMVTSIVRKSLIASEIVERHETFFQVQHLIKQVNMIKNSADFLNKIYRDREKDITEIKLKNCINIIIKLVDDLITIISELNVIIDSYKTEIEQHHGDYYIGQSEFYDRIFDLITKIQIYRYQEVKHYNNENKYSVITITPEIFCSPRTEDRNLTQANIITTDLIFPSSTSGIITNAIKKIFKKLQGLINATFYITIFGVYNIMSLRTIEKIVNESLFITKLVNIDKINNEGNFSNGVNIKDCIYNYGLYCYNLYKLYKYGWRREMSCFKSLIINNYLEIDTMKDICSNQLHEQVQQFKYNTWKTATNIRNNEDINYTRKRIYYKMIFNSPPINYDIANNMLIKIGFNITNINLYTEKDLNKNKIATKNFSNIISLFKTPKIFGFKKLYNTYKDCNEKAHSANDTKAQAAGLATAAQKLANWSTVITPKLPFLRHHKHNNDELNVMNASNPNTVTHYEHIFCRKRTAITLLGFINRGFFNDLDYNDPTHKNDNINLSCAKLNLIDLVSNKKNIASVIFDLQHYDSIKQVIIAWYVQGLDIGKEIVSLGSFIPGSTQAVAIASAVKEGARFVAEGTATLAKGAYTTTTKFAGKFINLVDVTLKDTPEIISDRYLELSDSLDDNSLDKDNENELVFAYNLKANLYVFSYIYGNKRRKINYITFKETFYYCVLDTLFIALNQVKEHLLEHHAPGLYGGARDVRSLKTYTAVAYAVLAQIEQCFWGNVSWTQKTNENLKDFWPRQARIKVFEDGINYNTIIKNTNFYILNQFTNNELTNLNGTFGWSYIDDDTGGGHVLAIWPLTVNILNSKAIKNSILKSVLSYISFYNFDFITSKDNGKYENIHGTTGFDDPFKSDTTNAETIRYIITSLKDKLKVDIEPATIHLLGWLVPPDDAVLIPKVVQTEDEKERASVDAGSHAEMQYNIHFRRFNYILRELTLVVIPQCWTIEEHNSRDFENFTSNTIDELFLDRSIIFTAINSYNNAIVISASSFFDFQSLETYYNYRGPTAPATGKACEEFNIKDSLAIILIVTEIIHNILKSFIEKITTASSHETAAHIAVKHFIYLEFKQIINSKPYMMTIKNNILNPLQYLELKENNPTNLAHDVPIIKTDKLKNHLNNGNNFDELVNFIKDDSHIQIAVMTAFTSFTSLMTSIINHNRLDTKKQFIKYCKDMVNLLYNRIRITTSFATKTAGDLLTKIWAGAVRAYGTTPHNADIAGPPRAPANPPLEKNVFLINSVKEFTNCVASPFNATFAYQALERASNEKNYREVLFQLASAGATIGSYGNIYGYFAHSILSLSLVCSDEKIPDTIKDKLVAAKKNAEKNSTTLFNDELPHINTSRNDKIYAKEATGAWPADRKPFSFYHEYNADYVIAGRIITQFINSYDTIVYNNINVQDMDITYTTAQQDYINLAKNRKTKRNSIYEKIQDPSGDVFEILKTAIHLQEYVYDSYEPQDIEPPREWWINLVDTIKDPYSCIHRHELLGILVVLKNSIEKNTNYSKITKLMNLKDKTGDLPTNTTIDNNHEFITLFMPKYQQFVTLEQQYIDKLHTLSDTFYQEWTTSYRSKFDSLIEKHPGAAAITRKIQTNYSKFNSYIQNSISFTNILTELFLTTYYINNRKHLDDSPAAVKNRIFFYRGLEYHIDTGRLGRMHDSKFIIKSNAQYKKHVSSLAIDMATIMSTLITHILDIKREPQNVTNNVYESILTVLFKYSQTKYLHLYNYIKYKEKYINEQLYYCNYEFLELLHADQPEVKDTIMKLITLDKIKMVFIPNDDPKIVKKDKTPLERITEFVIATGDAITLPSDETEFKTKIKNANKQFIQYSIDYLQNALLKNPYNDFISKKALQDEPGSTNEIIGFRDIIKNATLFSTTNSETLSDLLIKLNTRAVFTRGIHLDVNKTVNSTPNREPFSIWLEGDPQSGLFGYTTSSEKKFKEIKADFKIFEDKIKKIHLIHLDINDVILKDPTKIDLGKLPDKSQNSNVSSSISASDPRANLEDGFSLPPPPKKKESVITQTKNKAKKFFGFKSGGTNKNKIIKNKTRKNKLITNK